MKRFTINYAIKGMFTFLPLFREVDADTEEDAKERFNEEKRKDEYFCAITEVTEIKDSETQSDHSQL